MIYIVETLIWSRIVACKLVRKYSCRYILCAGIGMIGLMMLRINLSNQLHSDLILVLGSFILIVYTLVITIVLFEGGFIEKLLWITVYNIILITTEMFAVYFVGSIVVHIQPELEHEDFIAAVSTLMSKGLALLVSEFVIRREKDKFRISKDYVHSVFLIINIDLFVGLTSVYFIANKNAIIQDTQLLTSSIIIITFLFSILTVVSLVIISKKSNEQLEYQLKLQQIEYEAKFNEDMKGIVDDLRKLRHDMNNHVALMRGLCKAEQYDELQEYLDELNNDICAANEIVATDNKALLVILNTKINSARKKGIEFNSVIGVHKLNISDKDMCSLLGNILDNAIEAAEQVEQNAYIDFTMEKLKTGYNIVCENSYNIEPVVEKKKFRTNKSNASHHGIGIENIRDIVKHYHGEVDFQYGDQTFCVKVKLPVLE